MSHTTEPHRIRRLTAATITLLSLLGLGGAWAASRPAVENPHGKYRGECGLCHGTAGWKPARVSAKFDHAKYGFKLEGAHAAASCVGCHASLDFSTSQKQCASCHQDPHRGEMGTDCSRCHSARSFVDRGPMVRSHQLTRFPLTGSHAALDCEDCHKPATQGRLQFVNTQAECRACHMDEYRSARNPDHAAGGVSTECTGCHVTTTWSSARFDHSRSAFPLTGAHRTAACERCHVGGEYKGTAKDCFACHAAEYNAAQPPHAASGFQPGSCATCHNTSAWAGAAVNHDATSFPLTGAHRTATCASCHSDGVYNGKSGDCFSCHQSTYNSAVPNHVAAGYSPAACASCHTTTTWAGATSNHDAAYFRIYVGGHANRWTACADCHPSPTSFATFNCLGCHPHSDKAKTDGNHVGKSGYRYESTACYSCHAR